MIGLETTDKSIHQLLEDNEVDAVIHGCNCFHKMTSPIAITLNKVTDGDVAFVDVNFSEYGDINNLGTSTACTYNIYGKQVEVYNFYSQYTLTAPHCQPVHWNSVYQGLLDLLSGIESGHTVAIGGISTEANSKIEFTNLLTALIKDNDDELPDINVIVVEH